VDAAAELLLITAGVGLNPGEAAVERADVGDAADHRGGVGDVAEREPPAPDPARRVDR